MNVTPELVKAEMDYRVERALADAAPNHVREARRAHRSWVRRLRELHGNARPTAINGTPRAA